MQLNPLTVQDPLDSKKVIINIQVNDDNKIRSQRSVLVTAGISEQVPVMLTGRYGQLNQLIDQAWQQFGQNESTNDSGSTTIASASVKPTKKPDQKNQKRDSILSLF